MRALSSPSFRSSSSAMAALSPAPSDEPLRRSNKCPLCPRAALRLSLFLKHLEDDHRDYQPQRREALWKEAERLEGARESGGWYPAAAHIYT